MCCHRHQPSESGIDRQVIVSPNVNLPRCSTSQRVSELSMTDRLWERERELEEKAREVARRKFSDIAVLIYREQTNGTKGSKGKGRGKSPISPSPSIISLPVSPFLSTHAKLDQRHSRHSGDASKADEEEDGNLDTWPKIRQRAVNVKAHSGLVGSPVVPRYRHAPLEQQTLSVPSFGRISGSPDFFKGGSEERDTSPELQGTPPIFASIFDGDSRSTTAQTAWQCRPVQQPSVPTMHNAPHSCVPRIEASESHSAEGCNVPMCIVPDSEWSTFEPSPASPGYDRLTPLHDASPSGGHLRPAPVSHSLSPSSATVT